LSICLVDLVLNKFYLAEWRYKALLLTLAGVFLGLLINPYFPENIKFTFHHYKDKLMPVSKHKIEVGTEWNPTNIIKAAPMSFPLVLGFFLSIFGTGLLGMKWKREVVESFLLACLTLVLLFKAKRFIEIAGPFISIFVVVCGQELIRAAFFVRKISLNRQKEIYNYLVFLFLLACIFYHSAIIWHDIFGIEKDKRGAYKYQKSMHWLKKNSRKNEIVFHMDWDDFPSLFFWNSKNRYIVGLDPTYMANYSMNLFLLRRDIARGRILLPAHIIRDTFKADWVFALKDEQAFLFAIKFDPAKTPACQDPLLKLTYQDKDSVLFKVLQLPTKTN
ncbi:hypothetical protein ACFL35_20885, partial [Candidatus Riflebacteria bacterium]